LRWASNLGKLKKARLHGGQRRSPGQQPRRTKSKKYSGVYLHGERVKRAIASATGESRELCAVELFSKKTKGAKQSRGPYKKGMDPPQSSRSKKVFSKGETDYQPRRDWKKHIENGDAKSATPRKSRKKPNF